MLDVSTTWGKFISNPLEETPLPAGRRAAVRERNRTEAEIAAFEEFRGRVREIRVEQHGSSHRPTQVIYERPAPATRPAPHSAIRTAYRDTVLAVDHWQAEYGEATVAESFRKEFSPELADVLTSNTPRFSAVVRDQLVTESERSIRARKRALAHLDAEVDQLTRLRDQFESLLEEVRPVVTGNEPFDRRVERLHVACQSIEEYASAHQEQLHAWDGSDEAVFRELVYADLDTRYPALVTFATVRRLLDRLELWLWAGLL